MVAFSDDTLDRTFSALAHPIRRAILTRLALGESASVSELAQPFDVSLMAISKHLKVLEGARLIERSRHAQWRPCRLAPEPLREVAGWVERYRELWEERLDRLDDYLTELQVRSSSARGPVQRTESERLEEEHDDRT